jgi:hypothetical protein
MPQFLDAVDVQHPNSSCSSTQKPESKWFQLDVPLFADFVAAVHRFIQRGSTATSSVTSTGYGTDC